MWGGALTSIQYNKWLDAAICQCRKKLGEQESKRIVIPSMLLVQAVGKVESVKEAAPINNQTAVSKLHILEKVCVPFHIGG